MTSTRTRAFANRLTRGMLAAAAASVLLAGPAAAQNSGNVSMSAGADIVNKYYFRGIVQETGGFIMQPFLDASISFGAASITAGTWSSLHSVGDEGFAGAPQSFYETDFYAGIGGAAGPVGLDITYTAYMSPRGSWGTTKEVAFGLSIDNPVAPYATFAFETAGGADGFDKGGYFELGIRAGGAARGRAGQPVVPGDARPEPERLLPVHGAGRGPSRRRRSRPRRAGAPRASFRRDVRLLQHRRLARHPPERRRGVRRSGGSPSASTCSGSVKARRPSTAATAAPRSSPSSA